MLSTRYIEKRASHQLHLEDQVVHDPFYQSETHLQTHPVVPHLTDLQIFILSPAKWQKSSIVLRSIKVSAN